MSLEFADVFDCVDCGAQVRFRDDGGGDLLEKAACPYCGTVNDRALAVLRARGLESRAAERAQHERRRQFALGLAAIVGIVAVLAGVGIWTRGGELATAYAEVERAHAQVVSVRERQEATLRQWHDAPRSPDRDAELSGAENRVRVERRRYDEAAAAYNAQASGPWGGVCTAVYGLPHAVQHSDEEHW